MESRVRASQEQLSTLLEYMATHGDLARPLAGSQGRVRSDRLWTELTNILNAVGGGVSKTTDKWKKVWADWKSKTKKKALAIRHHARGTGGGPASGQALSASDERVLAIMGTLAVAGQDSVEELGFNRSINTAHDGPAVQDNPVTQDDSVYLEIVDETPQLTLSPQLSTSQPSNNWVLPSSSYQTSTQGRQPVAPTQPVTPAPPAQPVTPDPPAQAVTQAPPATPAPAAPSPLAQSPPTIAAPATPRRRRPHAPRTSAISPPTRRRLRLRSPATPQSAASPHRPRLSARRRRAPTPFERAASEFTAVEVRRLELEETRTRLQHERDSRALEIEHERNLVFNSLVNVAQAWLDYYRSRDNTEPLNIE
ncbi:myb-related transcription factor, partner of profilin [Spodoptera frugiperda]|uniref:Regulatory protein zeste n=1 Tax=Spodoptera frugiperda TaxID=7108 RepID=A0A2H1X3Z7_SPOFR|nr:myb-related transcription factor, partner of profilin [Spodoptera frugiperda]